MIIPYMAAYIANVNFKKTTYFQGKYYYPGDMEHVKPNRMMLNGEWKIIDEKVAKLTLASDPASTQDQTD
jgi:hypothetical protein